jgi:hypothetical protein
MERYFQAFETLDGFWPLMLALETEADKTSPVNDPATTDDAAAEVNRGPTLLLRLNAFTVPPSVRELELPMPSLDVFIAKEQITKCFHNKK